MNTYLIKFGNSSDIDGVCYSNGYKQQIFVCGTYGTPVFDLSDDVEKNRRGCDLNFAYTYNQFSVIEFCDILDEQLTALRHLAIVDNVTIFDLTDNCVFKPTRVIVTSQNQGDDLYHRVRLSFQTAKSKLTKCCNEAYINQTDCVCVADITVITGLTIDSASDCNFNEANSVDFSNTFSGNTCCGDILYEFELDNADLISQNGGLLDFRPNADNFRFNCQTRDLGQVDVGNQIDLKNSFNPTWGSVEITSKAICSDNDKVSANGYIFECEINDNCTYTYNIKNSTGINFTQNNDILTIDSFTDSEFNIDIEICCQETGECCETSIKGSPEIITATGFWFDTNSGSVNVDLDTLVTTGAGCGGVNYTIISTFNATANLFGSNLVINPTSNGTYSVSYKACCVTVPTACASESVAGINI